MADLTAAELVGSVKTIYTLPSTYDRLSEAINDPGSTMDEIAEVLTNDQSIAMRVLELANSAFYGFPSKIETISHALTLIGAQQVRDLVLGTAVIEMFDGISTQKVSMASFWKHSIACGLTSKIIASLRREPNVERFFVLGLLHDIGRMVMLQKIPQPMTSLMSEAEAEHQLLYVLEKKRFGFTHEDVGAELMLQWKFPPRLAESVRAHHRFSTMVRFPVESATAHIADITTHAMGFGGSGEIFIPPLNGTAWGLIGLDPSALQRMEKELERQLEEVLQIMLPSS